tara:strand:+ start:387 stop:1370 length:984 start_codon:yes stop_codon:yes gene_type:complete
LAKPIGIRSNDDRARYFVVCSDGRGGIITTTQRHMEPRLRKGLVFHATDSSMGPVEFHIQVDGPDSRLSYGERKAYRFTWLAITARERRSNLVRALKALCGINARISSTDDRLGDHRVLVFDAEQKQVRLINSGESVLPPVGTKLVSATPSIRNGGDPNRVRTQPKVLVDTQSLGRTGTDLNKHFAKGAPHERRHFATRASYVPKDTSDVHVGSKPMPVYFCAKETGLIEQFGRKFRVTFGWVGHTHCAFSVEPGIDVQIGNGVRVGVPASRVGSDTIWITGIVSRTAISNGRNLVEVDLRGGNARMNPTYRKLVEFFFHRSKDATR